MQEISKKATQHVWHAVDGTLLRVTCREGECLAELTLENPCCSSVDLEVLQQAKDDQGLPRGMTMTVWATTIELLPVTETKFRGQVWLPKTILPQRVPDCYFRVNVANTTNNLENCRET